MSTKPLGHPYTGDPPGVNPRMIWIKTVNGDTHVIDFEYQDKGYTDLSVTSPSLWNVPEDDRSRVLEVERMNKLRNSMSADGHSWRIAGLDGFVQPRHIVKAWFGPAFTGYSRVLPVPEDT